MGIVCPCLANGGSGIALLAPGETHIHDEQDGEHRQRNQRRRLKQEPDHDQDEGDVLREAHTRVRAAGRQPPQAAGVNSANRTATRIAGLMLDPFLI